MVAYNGVLDTLVAVAPKIRRNPAESAGFRRIVDHTYYVLLDGGPWNFGCGYASYGNFDSCVCCQHLTSSNMDTA